MPELKILKKESMYEEGILLCILFFALGIFFLIIEIFTYIRTIWLSLLRSVFFAIGVVIIVSMLVFSLLNYKFMSTLLYLWNELLYIFILIPILSFFIFLVPTWVYLSLFNGELRLVIIVVSSWTLGFQLLALVYFVREIITESSIYKSKEKAPEKAYKPPIESLYNLD